MSLLFNDFVNGNVVAALYLLHYNFVDREKHEGRSPVTDYEASLSLLNSPLPIHRHDEVSNTNNTMLHNTLHNMYNSTLTLMAQPEPAYTQTIKPSTQSTNA